MTVLGGKDAARISVIINTLNERANIANAIGSVRPWVDEVVVVDMDSDDGTQTIARSLGAQVFRHDRLGYADPARAFAVSKTTGNWIVVLDADEMIPAPLGRELRRIAEEGRADVVMVHMRNFLFGREMLGGGYGAWESVRPRMFRQGAVAMSAEIHNIMRVEPKSTVLTIPPSDGLAVLHFNYLDVAQYIDRLNRYTRIEAETGHAPRSTRSMLVWVLRELVARYIRRRGYRDGWRGVFVSGAMAFYRLAAWAKWRESRERGADTSAGTPDAYSGLKTKVLGGYETTEIDPLGQR